MKRDAIVRNYWILPCLLLVLNLVNSIIGYKAGMIANPVQRTMVVMLLVLFGGSVTAFLFAPALEAMARSLHKSSRRGAGWIGELIFLVVLGAVVFWLYYRLTTHGVQTLVPPHWQNSPR